MPELIDSTERGLVRRMTLDGIDFVSPVESLSVVPRKLTTRVPTADGGSRLFGKYLGQGHANFLDSYMFALRMPGIYGDTLEFLSQARAQGGWHLFTHWKPIFAYYTAKAAQTVFYLPRFRRNAGQTFAGLVYEGVTIDNDTAPFKVEKNGVAVAAANIDYVTGPTVPAPAAGRVGVAELPLTSGANRDYVEVRFGTALAAGDTIRFEWIPAFVVEIDEVTLDYPQTIDEAHGYTFTER